MAESSKPLSEACLLLPLKPPQFLGTLDEYRFNRMTDSVRHAGVGVSPKPMPLASYRAGDTDAPQPNIATPATSTTPRPVTSGSSISSGVRGGGGVLQDGMTRPSAKSRISPMPHPAESPHRSADLGSPRVVDPLRAETPRRLHPTASTAALQRAHTDKDLRSLIRTHPSIASKLYTIRFTLDENHHPHHVTLWYAFGVDTAGITTWGYGGDFGQIPPLAQTDSYPDVIPWEDDQRVYVKARETMLPVNVLGEDVPWEATGAPRAPNEWCVLYGDGASVYVRHVPDSVIKADFPCWSWVENCDVTCPLQLPTVLAFGANSEMVKYPPVDGMIGLGVPNLRSLHHYAGPMDERVQFFDALEEPQPQVYEPRRFLIKLNHPDKVDLCHDCKALDFLSFGEKFPCPLKPRFTPKIAVYPSSRVAGSPIHRSWMLGLKSLNLLDPNSDDPSALKINMVNPNAQVVAEAPEFTDLIHVIIDSGTSATYLPQFVLDVIRESWLLNAPDVLAHEANTEVHSYCGPERNLDECEIVFEFVGLDGSSVEFRCPAKPFLKSHIALPSERGQTPETRFCSNVGPYPATAQIADSNRQYFVLGINFYWSAFVEHCGPIKDKRTRDNDYSKFSSPYVRLAPQRARKPDGTMGYAEDFTFFPDLAPRYYHASPES